MSLRRAGITGGGLDLVVAELEERFGFAAWVFRALEDA